MSKVIKAPVRVVPEGITVFLAGSIEMGAAEDWQTTVERFFARDKTVTYLFNPRRVEWDSSWAQSIHNEQFCEQVNWETDHIELADVVFFYFDPKTKSPITLMELGYCLGKGKKVVVCCPDGFWRKGNVDVMCDRHDVTVFEDIHSAILDLIMTVARIKNPPKPEWSSFKFKHPTTGDLVYRASYEKSSDSYLIEWSVKDEHNLYYIESTYYSRDEVLEYINERFWIVV